MIINKNRLADRYADLLSCNAKRNKGVDDVSQLNNVFTTELYGLISYSTRNHYRKSKADG